ncbi:MAG TPA: hypothetical protein VGP93_03975 [Polyangiaceae bacterium]|nr:hypothetical protein [Polyangiaceae bacterium]
MKYKRFSLLACATLTIAGCIGPQGASQPCTETASNSAAPAKNSSSAEGPEPLIAAVVPKGTLIWDGQGISNLPGSIEPPGSWFVYSDKTAKGVKKPPSVEEFTSAIENGALHTTGTGYTEWGGGVGTNLVGSPVLTPVDATKYKGFKFKASGSTPMKFLVATVDSMPEFGRCKRCYDHYMVLITDLSKEPKTYEFKWSDLKQTGWGDKVKFDPKSVVGLNWTSKDAVAWDFTIDDVAFLE